MNTGSWWCFRIAPKWVDHLGRITVPLYLDDLFARGKVSFTAISIPSAFTKNTLIATNSGIISSVSP